jgi:carboxymethylenebutenolidase
MLRTLMSALPIVGASVLLASCAGASSGGAGGATANGPVPNASAMAPAEDVVTRDVVYATVNGDTVTGYLAEPLTQATAPLPSVVMIHEWWGLNDNIRMMARRLAGEGYRVLAVDLYGGHTAQTPAEAGTMASAVGHDPQAAEANLKQAADYLIRHEHATKVGILGWCFGGGWSLRGALAMPSEIDAAVVYYGQPITDASRLQALDAPLLGIYGGRDQGIPVDTVRAMESQLKQLGKDVTIFVYPAASHAFANPSGRSYQPEAAEDAWKRTLSFLAAQLKGAQG